MTAVLRNIDLQSDEEKNLTKVDGLDFKIIKALTEYLKKKRG